MGLVLTEEQTLLKETASQFFQEKLPVANLRKLRDEFGTQARNEEHSPDENRERCDDY